MSGERHQSQGFSAVRARLQVWSSSITPDEITRRLDIEPAGVGVKGEVWNTRTGAVYTCHLWESRVVGGTSGDIAAYVAELVETFMPHSDALSALAGEKDTDVVVLIAIEIDSDRHMDVPILALPANLVSNIAALGAKLDVDIQMI